MINFEPFDEIKVIFFGTPKAPELRELMLLIDGLMTPDDRVSRQLKGKAIKLQFARPAHPTDIGKANLAVTIDPESRLDRSYSSCIALARGLNIDVQVDGNIVIQPNTTLQQIANRARETPEDRRQIQAVLNQGRGETSKVTEVLTKRSWWKIGPWTP